MKLTISAIAFVIISLAIVGAIRGGREPANKMVSSNKIVAVSPFDQLHTATQKSLEEIKIRGDERLNKLKYKNWSERKTKVFIEGKNTKECMRKLGTETINNQVVECSRDHFIEIRNDELAKFKEEENLR